MSFVYLYSVQSEIHKGQNACKIFRINSRREKNCETQNCEN